MSNKGLTLYEKMWLEEARSILLQQLERPLTAALLAELVGLTPYKLAQGFRTLYGKSVSRYLTEARVRSAKELLLQTNERAKVIGERCGFLSAPSFHRIFKEHTGLTPEAFRRKGEPEAQCDQS